MAVHAGLLRLETAGHGAIVDLTGGVAAVVRESGASEAVATVAAVGSTVAVTTMELEPGGVQDLSEALERLIPAAGDYAHNRLNHDTNSHAHMRAAIVGPSESIPVVGGRLALGTWQQLVLLDFDDRPRQRTVHVHVAS
ncbi:MAG TPA: secondary thiamine-phosphate synthase enzyme YjbQ [Solirubrobacteraceae bacterium]|nr:secondary thiamine-phosphate synthase enzyme YjbQ [Solirubrobacteraceae bacterium]